MPTVTTFTDPHFTTSPIGMMSESIFAHFRPRTEMLPVPSAEQLQALTMPVMAVLGGKDVFIDTPQARASLERNVARLAMRYLPEGLHFLPGQTEAVPDFLRD